MHLSRNRVAIPLLWGTAGFCLFLYCAHSRPSTQSASGVAETNRRSFPAIGLVREISDDRRIAVIAHETITNYMPAMSMPFKVRDRSALDGIQSGDKVSFRLQVTDTESWIDHIIKIGEASTLGNH